MPDSKFKSIPGQVDYHDIRYAPVINCVLKYLDKILIVKRSQDMNFYPGYWNGISGFLDDMQDVEQKVKQEIKEEAGIEEQDILSKSGLGKVTIFTLGCKDFISVNSGDWRYS